MFPFKKEGKGHETDQPLLTAGALRIYFNRYFFFKKRTGEGGKGEERWNGVEQKQWM